MIITGAKWVPYLFACHISNYFPEKLEEVLEDQMATSQHTKGKFEHSNGEKLSLPRLADIDASKIVLEQSKDPKVSNPISGTGVSCVLCPL